MEQKLQGQQLDANVEAIGKFAVKVHRKNIKHIYFRIYPAKKKVVISTPYQVGIHDLNRVIRTKLDWIKQKMAQADLCKKEPACNYISQEKIFFQGRRFFLKITESKGKAGVFVHDENLVLKIRPLSGKDQATRKLDQWLRAQLVQQIQILVEKWEPVLGVQIREFRVRKMKTRWGSCNIRAGRIWLNQVLVHLSPIYLEYVVVHEMVHLLERKHDAGFKRYMDQFIPNWRDLNIRLKAIDL